MQVILMSWLIMCGTRTYAVGEVPATKLYDMVNATVASYDELGGFEECRDLRILVAKKSTVDAIKNHVPGKHLVVEVSRAASGMWQLCNLLTNVCREFAPELENGEWLDKNKKRWL